MHKVLFIAYFFPPIGGSGVQRPAKFVKYLPLFGWQPYVIATDHVGGSEGVDESLLADVPPGVQVWRISTPHPQPVTKLQRWVGYHPPSPAPPGTAIQSVSGRRRNLFRRVRRAILSPLYLIQEPPVDRMLWWSLRIVPLAYQIIRRAGIEVIFTTSPPWSLLLTGLVLKKVTGCPWVADFRDPWTTDQMRYPHRGWRRRLDSRLERLCLNVADRVVTVMPTWRDDLRRQAGTPTDCERFLLITNGFDHDDFVGIPSRTIDRLDGKVVLFHAGSLYRGALMPLLQAFEHLEPAIADRLRVQLIGYLHPDDEAQLSCSSVGRLFAYQPDRIGHPEAISRMREAHVLLLPMPFDYYPGKVFEYMQVGRPVLAIAQPGAGADLVREVGIGCVVPPNDVDRLAHLLCQIALDYEGFVHQHYQPNWQMISQFDRRVLTGRLTEVFEEVARSGR